MVLQTSMTFFLRVHSQKSVPSFKSTNVNSNSSLKLRYFFMWMQYAVTNTRNMDYFSNFSFSQGKMFCSRFKDTSLRHVYLLILTFLFSVKVHSFYFKSHTGSRLYYFAHFITIQFACTRLEFHRKSIDIMTFSCIT